MLKINTLKFILLNITTMCCIIPFKVHIFALSSSSQNKIISITMNNILIAALTLVMLPAISKESFAKSGKQCKTEMTVEKVNFTDDIINNSQAEEEMTNVRVDYIIEEDGNAYITYIEGASETAKNEVIRFIEGTVFNFNIVPGKVYSMQLTLKK